MKKPLYFLALFPAIAAIADTNQVPNKDTSCLTFTADGSFTYWYAKEDGLNVAESAFLTGPGAVIAPPNGTVFKQEFGYKPGFKVSLGMESVKRWDLRAEYTYFRGNTTASKAAPTNITSVPGIGVWNVDDWFLQSTPLGGSLSGTYLSSTWKLGMDLGDLTLSRPYDKDRNFAFAPFGGLRTVWLRQRMDVSLTQAASSLGAGALLLPQPLQSLNNSNAWGIGPRVGTAGKYGLPMGLRLDGLFGASLLYTKFTTITHSEGRAATFVDYSVATNMNDYNCVRPVLDVNLGLGWNTKWCDSYSFDISARYEFLYFWGQNMMRSMLDQFWGGTASGDLDLYFQGLTITAGFSF